eukprot:TRINITY_DN16090_c0_g2_i2.p1 TRINITY_DN16090_c0_g2~~TRINITY_DN16090_c0_g2_i2.p1  ORF type:complete len:189 (+),score=26.75 TRINITY_DN16090_c0_g2_i2:194-760(+)
MYSFPYFQLDENNHLDKEEFLLIARCIEPIKLPQRKALMLFNKLSDRKMTNEGMKRLISFRNFAIGSVENGLFSLEAQKTFLNVKDKADCLKQLKEMNAERMRVIEERFKMMGSKGKWYRNSWYLPIEKALSQNYEGIATVLLIKLKLLEAESVKIIPEYVYYIMVRVMASEVLGSLNSFVEILNNHI